MQTSTVIILACLIAVVVAQHQESVAQEVSPDLAAHESIYNDAEYERSPRAKRGLLLLKKKLLLGALGLKAAKIGALGVGAVGLAGLKHKGLVFKH